jgi:hypothetical protein
MTADRSNHDLRRYRDIEMAHLVLRFLACDAGGLVELLQRVQRDFRGYVCVLLISARQVTSELHSSTRVISR